MKPFNRSRWLVALVATAVIAAACGSDATDGAATEAQGDILDEGAREAVEEAVRNSTPPGGATGGSSSVASIDEYEALWAEERAAIVEEIVSNGWGWDQEAGLVTGPGGFEVDLSQCAAGWDPYGGLEDGVIRIGQTVASSGIAADWGNAAFAQQVYFDSVNANGGITDSEGRTYIIQNESRDDAYDPAKTVPLVDELLDSEGVFAVHTAGSPNTLKVYEKLGARCVPNPYVISGHPAWGDPVNFPWTWGHLMAYNTEAILWGSVIEAKLADQDEITVAALIIQNDFGKAYEVGFENYLATSNKNINFVYERIEPTAAVVTNQMTTLAARNPDVFVAMIAGTPCSQAVIEAANNGLKDTATLLFLPSVCKAMSYVGQEAVGGDGSASDGWWIVGGGVKDFNDTSLADDPWVTFARELLEDAGRPSEDSSLLSMGFGHAWPMVQALLVSAELPGGVSRPNFMIAARMLDMTNPNLLDGIGYNMRGAEDPYPTEGSELGVFDSERQTWVIDESIGIVELSGRARPCAWDQASGSCG